jgi:hypothetical protein
MDLPLQMDASSVLEVVFRSPPPAGVSLALIKIIRSNAETLVGLMKILSCGGTIDQAMLNQMEWLCPVERTLLAGWISAGFQGKEIFSRPYNFPIARLLAGEEFTYGINGHVWKSYRSSDPDVSCE